MKKVKKALQLSKHGTKLWTRPAAQAPKAELAALLKRAEPGETVTIDLRGVEVFDFSFANEFFAKAALELPREFPERMVVVTNLNEYTREDLSQALTSLGLAMVERGADGRLSLLGRFHQVDAQTFAAVAGNDRSVTAVTLKDRLSINLTAVNERLTKLTNLGLICRRRGVSSAGREQYEYSAPE